MELLQIGSEDWVSSFDAPEGVNWHYTPIENLEQYLEKLKEEKLAKILPNLLPDQEVPTIKLHFGAVFLTDFVEEKDLEILGPCFEAYTIFYDNSFDIDESHYQGVYRRKRPQKCHFEGSRLEKIAHLTRLCFSGQYGAKLKLGDIDISPQFEGHISYEGNIRVNLEGDFGETFSPLFTYRYNLPHFSMVLDLFQEHTKRGACQFQMRITPFVRGSVYERLETIIVNQAAMEDIYRLEPVDNAGFYCISIWAKGQGLLSFGHLHWRYSREGYGHLVLGGQRICDSRNQEALIYFNPGDLKPPLNVYFSGYRPAEGFEGFGMMKSLKCPFVLVADPRIEGGGFYIGSPEYEKAIADKLQEALDYLGFTNKQLILSGMSMGSFGALYYASRLLPHSVIVNKPFTNLGDVVDRMPLHRPNEFETIGDILMNNTGGSGKEQVKVLNDKFWSAFKPADFSHTEFAIAYMEHDDYDNRAAYKLVDYFAEKSVHIVTKGYPGRHNDNSRAVNNWLLEQFVQTLKRDFGRIFD
ncbi:accessory Sec system protein Asp2 [Streptococcus plurextorum]|uniref:accessory Sec system protein Asp2 n=1 Tax=Streptococcus plurextorum TaxID=456876 RepID=UPI00041456E2|nr:accessory Sec system protein Asp2 [Streptococcus plurextorum]